MPFGNIGVPGLILIVILALIIFGPSKLPELGRAFGRTLSEFKQATRSLVNGEDDKPQANEAAAAVAAHAAAPTVVDSKAPSVTREESRA